MLKEIGVQFLQIFKRLSSSLKFGLVLSLVLLFEWTFRNDAFFDLFLFSSGLLCGAVILVLGYYARYRQHKTVKSTSSKTDKKDDELEQSLLLLQNLVDEMAKENVSKKGSTQTATIPNATAQIFAPDCAVIVNQKTAKSYIIPFERKDIFGHPDAFNKVLHILKQRGMSMQVLESPQMGQAPHKKISRPSGTANSLPFEMDFPVSIINFN